MSTAVGNLGKWLQECADSYGIELLKLPYHLGSEEVRNREMYYEVIRKSLSQPTIDYESFEMAVRNSWSLSERYFKMKLNLFLRKKSEAIEALSMLVNDFPSDEDLAIIRIDEFIGKAVKIAFTNKTGVRDYSGAALLASVIISSLFEYRFVDFRNKRWEKFCTLIGEKYNDKAPSYGALIFEASKTGIKILNSKEFTNIWGDNSNLWTISSICWESKEKIKKLTPSEKEYGFPEGKIKERLHKYHERNPYLVKEAKRVFKSKHGRLLCEVCDFEFSKKYGLIGEDYIEAHHKKEVAKLTEDHKTKIADLAMLCADCHRMIHRGKKTLSLSELKALIIL